MKEYNEMSALNKMAAELRQIYEKNNTDPRGAYHSKALDIIDLAAYQIALLANEKFDKEKGDR